MKRREGKGAGRGGNQLGKRRPNRCMSDKQAQLLEAIGLVLDKQPNEREGDGGAREEGEGQGGAVDWFLPPRYVKYRDELEDG